MRGKFIQIAVAGMGSDIRIFALDDEGEIWWHAEKESHWIKVADIEEED